MFLPICSSSVFLRFFLSLSFPLPLAFPVSFPFPALLLPSVCPSVSLGAWRSTTGSSSFEVVNLRSETLVSGSPAKVLLRSENLAQKDLRSRKVMLRSPESRPAKLMLRPQGFLSRASVRSRVRHSPARGSCGPHGTVNNDFPKGKPFRLHLESLTTASTPIYLRSRETLRRFFGTLIHGPPVPFSTL